MKTTRISRAAAALTALAAVAAAAGLVTGTVQALPPGTAATPGQTLSPTSGNKTTSFTLSLAAPNNVCPGDTATGGFRWNQYITSAGVDAGTLTWDASGPIVPAGAPAGSIAQPLYSTAGTPQVNRNTAVNTGQITGTSTLNLDLNTLSAGEYKIGFACSKSGQTERYWQTLITVSGSGAGITWVQGTKPGVPTSFTANGSTSTGGQITGSFAVPVGTTDPAISSYTVTATPQGGGAPVTLSPAPTAAGSYTITGLTNGTTYDVTVTATNSVGTSSAATVSNVLVEAVINAPSVSTVGGTDKFTVNWTPTTPLPAGAVLVSHRVTVSPSVAGSPFTVLAGTNTLEIPAASGDYSVTVQGIYNTGYRGLVSGGSSATSTAAFIGPVTQQVIVERPKGALVLTQRCNVFGSAPAFSDNTFGPLPALAASPASADPTNANPILGWSFGTNPVGDRPTGETQPRFDQYPYPVDANGDSVATYPTACSIQLGNAKLLTSGEFAGAYFAATGRINQITVVDTRDTDAGWTLNGQMGTFTSTSDPTDTFHGNLMGWDPEVTWDSAGAFDGYNMTVAAGPSKNPRAETTAGGLRNVPADNRDASRSLAKAEVNQGLGMAVIDARLRLLIPVSADEGEYRGTLTFTVV